MTTNWTDSQIGELAFSAVLYHYVLALLIPLFDLLSVFGRAVLAQARRPRLLTWGS